MDKANKYPKQDSAEGSRKTIKRDLKRKEEKRQDSKEGVGRDAPHTSSPGAEAAEPSPGG